MPSSGGNLDEALPQGDDQGVPTWSSDGSSVFFGEIVPVAGLEHAAIRQLDLQTRTVATIGAPIGMWSPRMSPDGKHLAAVSHDNKSLYVRDNARRVWRRCASMDFVAEPIWPAESSWIQFIGGPAPRKLYRVSPSCEPPREVADLALFETVGDAWTGIAPDHSPLALLDVPAEIYALDWKLRRWVP